MTARRPLPHLLVLLLPALAFATVDAASQAAPHWSPAAQQLPIDYQVRFPNAAHHEARITVTFPEIPNAPLEVRMSRTSPGRYALHEFAKNVYDVRAYDAVGRMIPAERTSPHRWTVRGHRGRATVEYTLYADHADGTYPGIDLSHAHLNMPAVFMWARGREDRPIRVTFHPPAESDWRVATQLRPTNDSLTFTAPGLAYFMDSPTELSDFTVREWQLRSGGRTQTIRLAVHHEGTDADVDRFAELARRVVEAQVDVFGAAPAFDHGEYTFIADYLPWVHGDGMEHRNSTILSSTRPLAGDGALRNLGTLSHEFFHAWNMERLRSAALEPFDWERANMSRELWFGEGFTSYYDDLTIARAGIIDLDEYAAGVGRVLDRVVNSTARRHRSAVEMSMHSPFVDEARWVDPTNGANTFLSYYSWGAAIALGLDLTLRTEYDTTLDHYMRALWRDYGARERPYGMADLKRALADLTGDPDFAAQFFERYIEGRDVVDYESLLARAGLLLRRAEPGAVWVGAARLVDDEGGSARVASATREGGPLYAAGVDRGDRIRRLAGHAVGGAADVDGALAGHSPGDVVDIVYEQRGRTRREELTLAEDPALELVTYEAAGREVTATMRALREAWIGVREPAGT